MGRMTTTAADQASVPGSGRDISGSNSRETAPEPVDENVWLEDIYGEGEIRVNSYHHQGIRKIAPGFRAGALAPDGLVEAIEWKGEDWFCVGVQWHPHKEGTVSLDMQLIEAFVNAAAKAAVSTKPKLSLAKAG